MGWFEIFKGVIQFNIPRSESTFLVPEIYMRLIVRIMKWVNKVEMKINELQDNVSFCDAPFFAMFQNFDLQLNGVTVESVQCYNYQAYINEILGTSTGYKEEVSKHAIGLYGETPPLLDSVSESNWKYGTMAYGIF